MKGKIYGTRKQVYNQVANIVKKYNGRIGCLFCIQFLFLIGAMMSPYLYGLLIDEVMVNKSIAVLKWICIGYFILFCLDSMLIVIQRNVQVNTYNAMKTDIRKQIWKKYMEAPYRFYEKYESGDLKQRMDTDVNAIENFFNEQVIKYLYDAVSVIVYLIVIFIISWELALFSLLMVPVSFWLTKQMAHGSGEAWGRYRQNFGKYEGWLQGSLQNWKEIKVLNAEENQLEKFNMHWRKLKPDFYKGCLYFYINRSFIGFSDFFITKMNLYFIGGLLIFHGDLKIGMLFVFIKYYEKFFAGITDLTNANMRMAEYGPSLSKIIDILNLELPRKQSMETKPKNYDIQFNNVGFQYADSTKEVLKNVNLVIEENKCTAIVGRSGNGKTTLIKLLTGLYDNYTGSICIGNRDIKEYMPDNTIAVVMQDSILFNTSITKNMYMVKSDATKEDIIDACKKAFIHEDIMNMPNQYDSIIGEKGVQLSGGQKQRIAIARAILVNPKILIMDEATSALDTVSEQMINKTIQLLKGKCSIVIIAHRMSSIMLSDSVVVIEDLTVAEEGKYTELMNSDTVFEQIFKEQYSMV